MKILTLNAGSNSLKFEVVTSEAGSPSFGASLLAGSFDDIGKQGCAFKLLEGKREQRRETLRLPDHGAATAWLLDWMDAGGARAQGVDDLSSIERVGHRIVHGADRLVRPELINEDVLAQIAALRELAPLHTESVLNVIEASRPRFTVPMIAVIDSAFHRTIPDEAALYPLPREIAARHHIRRYGFHGISHQYLTARYAEITGRAASGLNLVTLHLEGGSSAAAIRGGRSVDTSMGFTPLEGLMMGTRCGDIDPSILLHLLRNEKWDGARLERFLNRECGLIGVSGISADTRELRNHLDQPAAKLAWDMFCYRVSKYVAAYLAVLGGADAIIFGGGIGENMPPMREQICARLAWCGAILDEAANNGCVDGEARVSAAHATIPVWVIPTREGLMMAAQVAAWRPE